MSRSYFSADTTFVLDVAGNDSGVGDISDPWVTPQTAIEKIKRDYDFQGYIPILKFNDGSWHITSGLTTFISGNGPCVGAHDRGVAFNILGNQSHPENCIINYGSGEYAASFGNHFVGSMYGFTLRGPSSGTGGVGIFATNYGSCDFGDIRFEKNGDVGGINVFSLGLGTLLMYGTNSSIVGNAAIPFAAQRGGQFAAAANIDIPNALTFVQYAQAVTQGLMDLTHLTYTGAGKNSCVGKKASSTQGSTITINGNNAVLLGNVAQTWDSTSSIA